MDYNPITIEGNKLIAKFEGCKVDKKSYNKWWYKIKETNRFGYEDDLAYHISWHWLMPVVEKIINYRFPDEHNEHCYLRTFGIKHIDDNIMVRFNRFELFYGETLIEATWLAVVNFIQWYNSTPK